MARKALQLSTYFVDRSSRHIAMPATHRSYDAHFGKRVTKSNKEHPHNPKASPQQPRTKDAMNLNGFMCCGLCRNSWTRSTR
eukprot:1597772-Amphidinium_carterae.1